MQGVCPRNKGRADNGRGVEITLAAGSRSHADGFVGELNVERIAIGFTVDSNSAYSEFPARVDDAKGDFTAIGN